MSWTGLVEHVEMLMWHENKVNSTSQHVNIYSSITLFSKPRASQALIYDNLQYHIEFDYSTLAFLLGGDTLLRA